ncbi:UvrD-helicase domain-containing protein [Streptomyces coeruleorubidus]|uniref:UvrD-helicase domain-containing protein n=1 Tax=Streptomyces coeruleorubidus TaxID=116188 RepID=UPI0033B2968A
MQITNAVARLTTRLESKRLRRPWNPDLHPRDSKGRFIETGGIARLWGGGMARVVRALGGRNVLIENVDTHQRSTIHASRLTMVARPDGTAPTKSKKKVRDEDERRVSDARRGTGLDEDDPGDQGETPDDPHDQDDQGEDIGEDVEGEDLGEGPEPEDDEPFLPRGRVFQDGEEATQNPETAHYPDALPMSGSPLARHRAGQGDALRAPGGKKKADGSHLKFRDTDHANAAADELVDDYLEALQHAWDVEKWDDRNAADLYERLSDSVGDHIEVNHQEHDARTQNQIDWLPELSAEAEELAELADRAGKTDLAEAAATLSDALELAHQRFSAHGSKPLRRPRKDTPARPSAWQPKPVAPAKKTASKRVRRDPNRRFKTLADVRAHWASGNVRPFTTSERQHKAHIEALPGLMDKLEKPQLSRHGHFTVGKLPAKKPSDGPYGWAVTHNDTGIRLVLTPRKAEAIDFANRMETAELNGKPVDWNDPSAFDAFRSKEGLELAERLKTEAQTAFASRAAKKRDGATARTKPAPPTPDSATQTAQNIAAQSGVPAANVGVGHVGGTDQDRQGRPTTDDELRALWADGGAPGTPAVYAKRMRRLANNDNVELHLADHRGFAIVEYTNRSRNGFEVLSSGIGRQLMVNPVTAAGVFDDRETANRFALRIGSEVRDADGKTIDWGSPRLDADVKGWKSKEGRPLPAAILRVAGQFDVDRGAGDSFMAQRAQHAREQWQRHEAVAGTGTPAPQPEGSPADAPSDAPAPDDEQTQNPAPADAGGKDPVKTHLDRAAASLGPVMNELRDDKRWGQRLGRAVDQALGGNGDQDQGFEQLESVIEEGRRKLRSKRELDSSERRYLDQHAAEALAEVREARKLTTDRPKPPRPDGQRRPGTSEERRSPSQERAIATAELDSAVDQLILAQRGTLQDDETSRSQIERAQALVAAVRDGETDSAADLGEILAEVERGIRGRTDGLDDSSKRYWLNELSEARQALMRAEARLGDIETTDNRRTSPADTGADGSEQVRPTGTGVLGDVPSGGAAVPGQRAGADGVLRGAGQPDSGEDRGSGGDAAEEDAAGDDAGHGGVAAAGQESGDGADPGRGAVPAEGAGDGESGAGRDAAAAVDAARFRPGSQDDLAPSGERAKAKANVAAVRTLRRIQAENRPATPEEQQILARWSGWGSLPVVLSDKPNPNDKRFRDETGEPDPEAYARALKRWESFAEERAEIRELLDDKEWAAARKNTLNAHYTDSSLVQPVWDAIRSLGFRRGRVLEPGSGSGNFIGHAPDGAEMVGVELDPTSAAISQLLYPDAQVINKPFQDLRLPPDSFDLAIGNVPFGRYKLHDPLDNPGRHHSIHDHFILKSLARVRPGGYVALVTSRYTMDSEDDSARRAMYDMADLVGAVRLPEGAHQRAAGTHVVTDLLLFRRREPGHTRARGDDSWLTSSKTDIGGYEIPVNQYFQNNPKNILGQMTVGSGQFTDHDLTVKGDSNTLVSMRAALGRIVADAKTDGLDYDASQQNADLSLNLAGDARDGSIARGENGAFMTVENGNWVELDVHPKQREQLGRLLHLKDLANRLVELEANTRQSGETNEMREARDALNLAYDAYVRKHPSPNKPGQHRRFSPPEALARRKAEGLKETPDEWKLPTALALFEEDPDGHMVFGLDRWDADAKAPRKLNILTERVLQPREIPDRADTPELAVAYALEHDGGLLNLPTVARMLGMDQDAAREALGDLAFDDPATKRLEPRAAYLSGNVRQKLAEAQAAAAEDPKYAVNVAALERVVPKDIRPKDIRVKIGAPWVPIDIYEGFLRHLGLSDAQVTHHGGNRWSVDGEDSGEIAKKVWGVKGRSAYEIFDSLLHQKLITIKESQEFPDGSKKTFVNQKATSAARTKAKDMAREFQKWVMDDPERAGRLGRIYNDKFNSIALRDYDDSPLTLPGIKTGWRMRPHQNAAIRRITQEPTTLLGHVVGAGKTATMVGGAMELRRTGLAKKPAIVVPNHMLEQFSRETVGLYPGAKVLAISRKDLHHNKRRKFIAKIAGGDWDVVVLTHDAFNAMPMTPQTQQAYMDEELALLRSQIEKIKERDGDDPSLKQMEQTLANQEEKLKERLDTLKDQRGIFFENTGIDYLFVDEAHEYKNLRTVSNLPGAAISGSGQATQLHMALGYLREHNESGRVATLATGTPIANSVTEAYVLMRYLAPQILEDAGIDDFDSWAATFGEVVTSLELAPDGSGEYREKARFAKFFNVPELLVGYRTFADIQTAADLGLPTPPVRAGKNGRRGEVISIPASIEQRRYVESLADEDWIKDPGGILKAIGFASRAAIDMRLQGGSGHEGGKLDAAAEQIAQLYEEHKDTVYPVSVNDLTPQETPGGLQLVFLDEGTPGSTGKIKFDAYETLRDLLVEQGVPREKVRFIHEAKDDKAKAKLFEEARNGKVAVLIGSTQKMGTGTNVQDRAVALHHLSFPWRPADMEQRDGRIERQGNLNVPLIPSAPGMTPNDVRIMYYITEGTFDEFRLGTLERKAVFINQMARRDFSAREMEDIGDAAVSLGTFRAIASGNPAIAERALAQAELVELQRQNADWYEQQQERRDRIAYLTNRIAALEQALPGMREALAKRRDVSGDKFQASIDGVDYDSRTDAAEVLGRRMDAIAKDTRYGDGATVPLGEIGGIGFLAEVEYDRDGNRLLRLRLDHAPAYTHSPIPETRGLWSARKVNDSSGRGAIQSLENLLRSLDGDIEKREKELDGSRTARREAEEHLAEGTSPYEEQVESTERRMQALTELVMHHQEARKLTDRIKEATNAEDATRLKKRLKEVQQETRTLESMAEQERAKTFTQPEPKPEPTSAEPQSGTPAPPAAPRQRRPQMLTQQELGDELASVEESIAKGDTDDATVDRHAALTAERARRAAKDQTRLDPQKVRNDLESLGEDKPASSSSETEAGASPAPAPSGAASDSRPRSTPDEGDVVRPFANDAEWRGGLAGIDAAEGEITRAAEATWGIDGQPGDVRELRGAVFDAIAAQESGDFEDASQSLAAARDKADNLRSSLTDDERQRMEEPLAKFTELADGYLARHAVTVEKRRREDAQRDRAEREAGQRFRENLGRDQQTAPETAPETAPNAAGAQEQQTAPEGAPDVELPKGQRWVHRDDVRPGDVVRFYRSGEFDKAALVKHSLAPHLLEYEQVDGKFGSLGSWRGHGDWVAVVDSGPDRTAGNRYIKRYGEYMRNLLAENLKTWEADRQKRNGSAQTSSEEDSTAPGTSAPAAPKDRPTGDETAGRTSTPSTPSPGGEDRPAPAASPEPQVAPADMTAEQLSDAIDDVEDRLSPLTDSTDPVDLAMRRRLERRLWELENEERSRWEREPEYDSDGKLIQPSRNDIISDRLAGYDLNDAEVQGLISRVEDLPEAKEGAYSDEEWERISAEASAREDYPPTDEQNIIIEGAARRGLNMAVMALAGTGKSSTLKMLSHRMPGKRIVYLAFNRSVAAEAREAQARGEYAKNMLASTANAYAARVADRRLNDRLPSSKVGGFKKLSAQQIADRMRWYDTVKAGNRDLTPGGAATVAQGMIRQWAKSADGEMGPQHVVVAGTDAEAQALFKAVKPLADRMWANLTDPEAGDPDRDLTMDFDYIVKQWALSGYKLDADVLFWDEAQDVNPVMEGVVRAALDQGVQVVAVGDSNQAIYGFRGASDALAKLPVDARATLTQSFRFGPAVADVGNRFLRLLGTRMRLKGYDRKQSRIGQLQPGEESMVIARTNAGVALAAVQALTAGRTVAVSGGVKALQEFVQAANALAAGEDTDHAELARFNGKAFDDIVEEVKSDPDLQQLASLFNLLEKHGDDIEALLASGSRPAATELVGDRVWVRLDWNDPKANDLKRWLGDKNNGVGKLLYDAATRRYYYEPGKREVPWRTKNGRSGVHKVDNKLSLEEAQKRIDAHLSGLYPQDTDGDGKGRLVPEHEPHDVLVTTAHKAKGLESQRVRIADDFKGPEEKEDGSLDWDADTAPSDEALRVAYVAVTRATEVLDPGSLGWVFRAVRGEDPTLPPKGEYRRDFELGDFKQSDQVDFLEDDGTPNIGVVSKIDPPLLTVLSTSEEPGIGGKRQEISPAQVQRRNGEARPLLPVASEEELNNAITDGRYGSQDTVTLDRETVRSELDSLQPEAPQETNEPEAQESPEPQPAESSAGRKWNPGDWAVTPNGEGRVILAEGGEVVVLDGGGAPRTYEPRQLSLPGEARTDEHDAPTADEAARQEKRQRDLEAAQTPEGLKLFYGSRLANLNLEEGHGLVLDEEGNEIGWVRRRGDAWLGQDARGGVPRRGAAESASDPLRAPREAAGEVDGERHSNGEMPLPLKDRSWRHLRPEEGRDEVWYSEFSDAQREEFFRLVKEWASSPDPELSEAAKRWGTGLNYRQMHRLADEFVTTANNVDTSTAEGRRRQGVLQRTADKVRGQARRAWLNWQSMPPPGEPDAVGNEDNPNWKPYGHRDVTGADNPAASVPQSSEEPSADSTEGGDADGETIDPSEARLNDYVRVETQDTMGRTRVDEGYLLANPRRGTGHHSAVSGLGSYDAWVLHVGDGPNQSPGLGDQRKIPTGQKIQRLPAPEAPALGPVDVDSVKRGEYIRLTLPDADGNEVTHEGYVTHAAPSRTGPRSDDPVRSWQMHLADTPHATYEYDDLIDVPTGHVVERMSPPGPVPELEIPDVPGIDLSEYTRAEQENVDKYREWAGVWATHTPGGPRNTLLERVQNMPGSGYHPLRPAEAARWIGAAGNAFPLDQYDENTRHLLTQYDGEQRDFLASRAASMREATQQIAGDFRADSRKIMLPHIATRSGMKEATEKLNARWAEDVERIRRLVPDQIAAATAEADRHGLTEQQVKDFLVGVAGGDDPEQSANGLVGAFPEVRRSLTGARDDVLSYYAAFHAWHGQDDDHQFAGYHHYNTRRRSLGAEPLPAADPASGAGQFIIGQAELPEGMRWTRLQNLQPRDIYRPVHSTREDSEVFDGLGAPHVVINLHADGKEGRPRTTSLSTGSHTEHPGDWVIHLTAPEPALRKRAGAAVRDQWVQRTVKDDDSKWEAAQALSRRPEGEAADLASLKEGERVRVRGSNEFIGGMYVAEGDVLEPPERAQMWRNGKQVDGWRLLISARAYAKDYIYVADGEDDEWAERLSAEDSSEDDQQTEGQSNEDNSSNEDDNDEGGRPTRRGGNDRAGGDRGDRPEGDAGTPNGDYENDDQEDQGDADDSDAEQRRDRRRRRDRDRDGDRGERSGGTPNGGLPHLPGRDRDQDQDRDRDRGDRDRSGDADAPSLDGLKNRYRSGETSTPSGADPQEHAAYLRRLADNDTLTLSTGGGLITWSDDDGRTWQFGHAASGMHLAGWEANGEQIGGRDGAARLADAYEQLQDENGNPIDWSAPELNAQSLRSWHDAEGNHLGAAIDQARQNVIDTAPGYRRDGQDDTDDSAAGTDRRETSGTTPTGGQQPAGAADSTTASGPEATAEADAADSQRGAADSQYTVNATHGTGRRGGTVDGRRVPTAKEMEQYETEPKRVVSEEGELALFGSPERMRELAGEGFLPTPRMRLDRDGQVWRNGRLIGNVVAIHRHSGSSEEEWWSEPPFATDLTKFRSREAAIAHLVLRDKERGEPDLSIAHPDLAWSLGHTAISLGFPAESNPFRGLESLADNPEDLERYYALRSLLDQLGKGITPSGNVADDLDHLHDELRWLDATHYKHQPVDLKEKHILGPGWLADEIGEYLDVLRPEDPRAQHHEASKNRAAHQYLQELLDNYGGRPDNAERVPITEIHEGDVVHLDGRVTGRYAGYTSARTGFVVGEPKKVTFKVSGERHKGLRITVSKDKFEATRHGMETDTFIIPAYGTALRLAHAEDVDLPFDQHRYGRQIGEAPRTEIADRAMPDGTVAEGERTGSAANAVAPAAPSTDGGNADAAQSADRPAAPAAAASDAPAQPGEARAGDPPGRSEGTAGSRRPAEPTSTSGATPEAPAAPEPVGGRPAEWVQVSDLQLGDVVRIDGGTKRGTARTLAGHVVGGPVLVPVTRKGRAMDMYRVLVADAPDARTGSPVYVMPDAAAARATRDDADQFQGSPQTGADSDVLTGRIADNVPMDASGNGLFPGSLVTDDDGREGVVTGASANSVRVQFGDDRTDDEHAPSSLNVTDGGAARPADWTLDGHRVRTGDVVGDRDGAMLGIVESVDGDTAAVATPKGVQPQPIDSLRVLGGVREADGRAPSLRLEPTTYGELNVGDVVFRDDQGPAMFEILSISEGHSGRRILETRNTTTGEVATRFGAIPRTPIVRVVDADGKAARFGPEDAPAKQEEITSREPAPAVTPVTGSAVDPKLSPEERDAITDRGDVAASAPEAQQAAARIANDLPVTPEQASALAEELREGADSTTSEGRTVQRAADHLDAAAGKEPEAGQPEPGTVGTVGVGDTITLPNEFDPDTLSAYKVLDIQDGPGGVRTLTIEDGDGLRFKRSLASSEPLYQLPEPEAPAADDDAEQRDPNAAPDADKLRSDYTDAVVRAVIDNAIQGTTTPGSIHQLRQQIAEQLTPEALRAAMRRARNGALAAITNAGIDGEERDELVKSLRKDAATARTDAVRAALRTVDDLEPLDGESEEDTASRAADLLRLIPEALLTRSAEGDDSDRDARVDDTVTRHADDAVGEALQAAADSGELLTPERRAAIVQRLAARMDASRNDTARQIAAALPADRRAGILPHIVAGLAAIARTIIALVAAFLKALVKAWQGSREGLRRMRERIARFRRGLMQRVRSWPETRRLRRLAAAGGLPQHTDGLPLGDRVAHWARLLPAPGRFGQVSRRARWYRPASRSSLAAGQLPEVQDGVRWTMDRAVDGGPGPQALRHLAAVRAAGQDVDADVVGRLTAAAPELGDDPHGTVRHASVYADNAERRLRDLEAAAAGGAPDADLEIAVARVEAQSARQEAARLQRAYAAALPGAVRDTLAELREMGPGTTATLVTTPESDPDAVRALTGIAQFVPRDWLSPTEARFITAHGGDAGAYDPGSRTATVADLGDDGRRTAAHALLAHLQQHYPDLLAAQEAFHFTRTHTGRVGARRRTSLDRLLARLFRNDAGRGETGDLVPLGLATLFDGQWYEDDDLRAFLLGLLATR